VGWVCCWFSSLLREVFLRVLRFSPLPKNKHFQISIRSWRCPQLSFCAKYRWHLNKVIYLFALNPFYNRNKTVFAINGIPNPFYLLYFLGIRKTSDSARHWHGKKEKNLSPWRESNPWPSVRSQWLKPLSCWKTPGHIF